MLSSDEDEVQPSTQFVSQEDDEQVLWEVIEITAENSAMYKVRWAGDDPATGKPWPQSWVLKHDCTPDLVQSWKLKQAKKRNNKSRGTSRSSKASAGSLKQRTRSSATPSADLCSGSEEPARASTSSRVAPNVKRRILVQESGDENEVEEIVSPRKKRRVEVRVPPPPNRESSAARKKPADEKSIESEEDMAWTKKKFKPSWRGKGKMVDTIPDIFDIIPGEENDVEPLPSESRAVARTSAKHPSTHGGKSIVAINGRHSRPSRDQSRDSKQKPAIASSDSNAEREHLPSRSNYRNGSSGRGAQAFRAKEKRTAIADDSGRRDQMPAFAHNRNYIDLRNPPTPEGRKETKRQTPPDEEPTQQKPEPKPRRPTVNKSKLTKPLDSPLLQTSEPTAPAEADDSLMNFGDDPPTSNNQETHNLPPSPPRSPSPPVQQALGNRVASSRNVADDSIVPETQSSANLSPVRATPAVGNQSPAKQRSPRSIDVNHDSIETDSGSAPVRKSLTDTAPEGISDISEHSAPHPISATSPAEAKSPKTLGRLPVVSPSKFKHYLSRIEKTWQEEDYVPSSIEQFSSPEKRARPPAALLQNPQGGNESDDDSKDAKIRRRGQELAARAAKERTRERRLLRKRKSLQGLLANHSEVPETFTEDDPEKQLATPSDLQQEQIALEMECKYIDLSGGVCVDEDALTQDDAADHAGEAEPALLMRMEEEETTQDIMRDMAARVTSVSPPGEDNVRISPTKSVAAADTPALQELRNGQETQCCPTSQASPHDAGSPSPPLLANRKSKDRLLDMKEIPPTASPAHQSSSKEESQLEPHLPLPSTDRLALGLLHTKSEEILSLEKTLAREQVRAEDLSAQVQQLEDRLLRETNKDELESKRRLEDVEKELQDVREALDDHKRIGSVALATQSTALEALRRSKAAVETDVEFFRGQYASASAFASELQAANAELTEKLSIAEGQVRDGLAMVKGFYEEKVKALERESTRWKALCHILQEKDARTGDDVRKRAAEAEELRAEVKRQQKQIVHLELMIEGHEADLEEWELKESAWDEEKAKLRKRLSNAEKRKTEAMAKGGRSGEDDKDSELVYRCIWPKDKGDKRCEAIFTSVQSLETHVIEHIPD